MSTTSIFQALTEAINGEVVTSSDDGYDKRRENFYGEFSERQPDAVVQVADATDVSRVVEFAGEQGVPLAVMAGGHSMAGHSSSDRGLVLDLSRLKGLEIDHESRIARAGGGLLAGEYTGKVAEHGLVTGFGDQPTVGITGLTLGGGIGFLHRKLGLTLDSVVGAEIVTADGQVREIDNQRDPDLFWAIRGGGGNFGVVTRLDYRLHPLDTVLGGMLILPATPEVIAEFVNIAADATDDLSVIAAIALAPPLPFLPEEVHGKLVIMGIMVHAGDPAAAEAEVGQFRKLATPLVDGIQTMPYSGMYEEEGGPPSPVAISGRSFFSDRFSLDDAETAVDALQASTAPMSIVQVRVLGGAVAEVPGDATAFAHRDRNMVINLASAFENPGDRPEHDEWVTDLGRTLQHGAPGVYVNFHADDSEQSVREAYPGTTWDRLVEVKTKYDRHNLFSSNHNIPPRD